MMYIKFVRPHGAQHPMHIDLDEITEKLYQLVIKHPDYRGFTYEDCGHFINLCCEGEVDANDDGDDRETVDVVCDIVSHQEDIKEAWKTTIIRACDYFGIDVPEPANW